MVWILLQCSRVFRRLVGFGCLPDLLRVYYYTLPHPPQEVGAFDGHVCHTDLSKLADLPRGVNPVFFDPMHLVDGQVGADHSS